MRAILSITIMIPTISIKRVTSRLISNFGEGITDPIMVQIWFQNRRQMTRRKSRPSLPLEIFSSQESTEHSFSSSPIVAGTSQPKHSSQSSLYDSQKSQGETQQTTNVTPSDKFQCSSDVNPTTFNETPPIISSKPLEHVESVIVSTEGTELSQSPFSVSRQDCLRSDLIEAENKTTRQTLQTNTVQENQGKSVKDHSDKRSETSHSKCTPRSGSDASVPSSRSLQRTSSSVRLSMSLDGKAQVVLENGTTPSPPRLQGGAPIFGPRHPNALRRSQSDYRPAGVPFDIASDSAMSWPSRTVPGRSRDARTWEFYCDSDTRNALTIQAEEEQKGSAEMAIGLVRSSSSKISRSSSEKRITHANTGKEQAKRKKVAAQSSQKPKLPRTASSVARLQTISPNLPAETLSVKTSGLKSSPQRTHYNDPSGDSDKENWEPGTQISSVHRRSAVGSPIRTSRAVLGENSSIPSHSTSLGALMNRQNVTPRRHDKANQRKGKAKESVEVDEEVATFMGESSLPREEEDLDCVQNLLSLSQGAWR